MKHKKAYLIGLMSLFLVGGVATSLAAITYHSASQDISGASDSAVYLKWDESTQLDPITNLKSGETQFRFVTLDATKSTNANVQYAHVKFTLSAPSDLYCMSGITVSIFKKDDIPLEKPGETYDSKKLEDLNSTKNTYTDNVRFITNNEKVYYTLAISYDGTKAEPGKSISANLNMHLSADDITTA